MGSDRSTPPGATSRRTNLASTGLAPTSRAVHTSDGDGKSSTRRVLTVLFTDIVGSTELAAELEDLRWRALLARHHGLVRRELRRFSGREVDTAGDGFLATFEEPTGSMRCAWAIREAVRDLGLEVRAGLHTGEVEVEDGEVRGIAVHTAARILGHAGPGQILLSGTTRELTAGSGVTLEDRGRRRLKGVPGTWRVFEVTSVDGRHRSLPLLPENAAERRRRAAEPPPRRRGAAIAVMAVGLVLAVVAFLLIGRGGEERVVRAKSFLARIDPTTAEVTRRITLDLLRWTDLAAGEGGVWLLHPQGAGSSVAHLDPRSGDVLARVPLPSAPDPKSVVVGERAVWILSRDVGLDGMRISQLNPATDRVLGAVEVYFAVGGDAVPVALTIGEGAVWAVSENAHLIRIDPVYNEVTRRVDLPGTAAGIAAGEGFVWMMEELANAVHKIEPACPPRSPCPVPRTALSLVREGSGCSIGGAGPSSG